MFSPNSKSYAVLEKCEIPWRWQYKDRIRAQIKSNLPVIILRGNIVGQLDTICHTHRHYSSQYVNDTSSQKARSRSSQVWEHSQASLLCKLKDKLFQLQWKAPMRALHTWSLSFAAAFLLRPAVNCCCRGLAAPATRCCWARKKTQRFRELVQRNTETHTFDHCTQHRSSHTCTEGGKYK